MDYTFLLVLAVILFSTKLLGIVMKKLGLPQVLGFLLAGIILGEEIDRIDDICNYWRQPHYVLGGTRNQYQGD